MTRPRHEPAGASDPALTPAVFHVLLALADGPLHGYGVMQAVAETSGRQMGPGTIYGTLQRLEDAGLVAEAASDDEGRRRFVMTASGRRALDAEAARVARLASLLRQKKLLRREA